MKKNYLCVKVTVLFTMALFLICSDIMAGGGVNWKVDVKNDTNFKCRVTVYKDKMFAAEPMDQRTLEPGQRTTFETGSLCPCAIEGNVFDPKSRTWKETRLVNVGLGNEISTFDGASAACWNSFWQLCRKAGTDADTMRDKDFSWCKY